MKVRSKRKLILRLFTLTILISTSLFTITLFNQVNLDSKLDTTFTGDNLGPTIDDQDNYFPESSSVTE